MKRRQLPAIQSQWRALDWGVGVAWTRSASIAEINTVSVFVRWAEVPSVQTQMRNTTPFTPGEKLELVVGILMAPNASSFWVHKWYIYLTERCIECTEYCAHSGVLEDDCKAPLSTKTFLSVSTALIQLSKKHLLYSAHKNNLNALSPSALKFTTSTVWMHCSVTVQAQKTCGLSLLASAL